MHDHRTVISHSMAVSGDITVGTHLIVEGAVTAAKIDTQNHTVIIGQYSAVQADVHGSQVLVLGQLNGNVFATEKIDIRATAVVNGDLHAPLIKLEEKSRLNGRLNYTGG
ncbi:MAG: polymer-forming cytoskeletal protein [Leptospirales bacterium]|nr:polymer-forming cytoskeletal protein [Leptospirales bacterium]